MPAAQLAGPVEVKLANISMHLVTFGPFCQDVPKQK
jgi:hypothetical protein